MTIEERKRLASRIGTTLAALESRYPECRLVAVLHAQLNTLALAAEDQDGQPQGTYGGVAGTVHPDSGGTSKGTGA
jgi:hypothetical protein